MSVKDCLTKLVTAGTITQRTADQALDMHDRMAREFTRTLPPASADAAAALAAAKALKVSAAAKIRNIHAQVNAFKAGEERLAEHPAGRRAALAGMFTRDLWRDTKAFQSLPDDSPAKRGSNVDYLSRVTTRDLYNAFAAGVKAYKPGFAGSTQQQVTGIRNMIRELFGVDTGDATAKVAGRGYAAATDQGVAWAQAAGKIFEPLENWRVPQHWTSSRVRQFEYDEFRRDVAQRAADPTALVLFDRDTSKPVTAANQEFIIRRAYDDIRNGTSEFSGSSFSAKVRTFNFQEGEAGAKAYMDLMEKYGYGSNPMKALTGHLDRMGREIGLMRVFGPNPEANFRALGRQVKAAPEIPIGSGMERFNPARLLAKFTESPGVIEGMWKVASGQAHAAQDDFISGVLGGLRNMNVASSLRQAVFSVVPTDAVTSVLAANHVGMEGIGHLTSMFTGGLSKDEAAHLNIQAHNMMDFVNGIHDYEDHISAMQVTGKFASGVTRATGLDWWGQMGKRTWAGDMLNLFASQAGKPFDRLDPNFARFLTSYGFTPVEWDTLRAGNIIDMNGAKYLDPQGMPRPLYERVMSAIDEQGAFAMHQPDLRLRSIETGTAYGASGRSSEVIRSLMQFKTFALSRMTTQLMRVFTAGPIESRVGRGAAFFIASMAAGAASVQALQILNGKDPFDMNRPDFWGKAFVKGGIGGYYGDLVESAMRGERSSGDVALGLAGPAASVAFDVMRLSAAPIRETFDPETENVRRSTLGRQLDYLARRTMPSTWYARLATDRLIWDQLQTLVDPDYRGSWRRMEQQQRRAGSGYWWAPGETAPERAPSFTH